ncbi:UxaA family hydrolase [Psychromonas sp. KJ10-10]|uniref:UxaA family hydrolase n=1 Tax=Psychromonas sp. KJ10-10 TaxID=3391823 RepID=UPI0039B57A8C
MKKFIKINEADNVVVCLEDFYKNEVIDLGGLEILLKENIHRGGKLAITNIEINGDVVKYGTAIGHATQPISTGSLVHTHNLKTNLSGSDSYSYDPNFIASKEMGLLDKTFMGFARENGDVGIRNEIWIIPTVGCVNGIAKQAIKEFTTQIEALECDGVYLFPHNYGCSQLGDDHENTKKILADMVRHPNAGGVLVIGLGCENNQIDPFKEAVGSINDSRVKYMVAQQVEDEIEVAVDYLQQIYSVVKEDQRTEIKIGKLKVGLECGGSDGLSGITANPLLGLFSDYLIEKGGTSVLTEVPEMFGAEHILFERCIDKSTFDQAVEMVNSFKQYFIDHNQPIYENPSPGNKAGGITTLEDKSMGCTQKAGSSTVMGVLKYGEVLKIPGLNLLSAPGNDAVATSALATSGCHMVLFSTGRGTPYGGFVPTVKLATNTELANKKKHWIDFNAGALLDGGSMPELLEKFIDLICEIASGTPTKNEVNDIRELAIFKSGVTL